MIILDHEQGTDEWFAARLGKPSASAFSRLITVSGKPSSSASKYIDELAGERLTGESEPFYSNSHMARGTELEPEARDHYEFVTGNSVKEYGFILDDSQEFGCSPDGIIQEGGLEIKCPAASTMVKYQRDPQELVKAYYQQIQGCIWITDSKWWDAFAYHPNMSHVLIRVERNEDFITKLAEEVDAAIIRIKNHVEKYK